MPCPDLAWGDEIFTRILLNLPGPEMPASNKHRRRGLDRARAWVPLHPDRILTMDLDFSDMISIA